jgi:FixJ family two-component response regulator
MPSMSGRELAQRLTTIRPDTKVLFVSGYTEDVLVQPFTFGRDVSFLQKPFTFAMLNQKVRDLLSPQLVSAATASS